MQRRVLGPEHPHTLYTLSDFAFTCQREGKYVLAETNAAQALAVYGTRWARNTQTR